jgi:hypothetical protein
MTVPLSERFWLLIWSLSLKIRQQKPLDSPEEQNSKKQGQDWVSVGPNNFRPCGVVQNLFGKVSGKTYKGVQQGQARSKLQPLSLAGNVHSQAAKSLGARQQARQAGRFSVQFK